MNWHTIKVLTRMGYSYETLLRDMIIPVSVDTTINQFYELELFILMKLQAYHDGK